MTYYDLIVVGASFAGIACAKAASANGLSVLVLERKKDVGLHMHTTGIFVHEAAELTQLPSHLYKEIKQVRLYSSFLNFIEVKSDDYIFLATDTPEVMRWMVKDAETSGVNFLLGSPFFAASENAGLISVNHGELQCKFLVGADGAKSKVADVFKLGKNKKFLIGTEYEYTGIGIANPDAFYCFLNRELAKGYIGWVIPSAGGVTQIGLAKTYDDQEKSRPNLEDFLSFIHTELDINEPKIVEKRGGLIPIGGVVKPFYRGNVILVGDAAGIVSPLTAGGIHTALFYGDRLGHLIAGYLLRQAPHPGKILMKEYPEFLHKHIYRMVFNITPDWLFNFILKIPFFRIFVNMMFFLKKRLPRSAQIEKT